MFDLFKSKIRFKFVLGFLTILASLVWLAVFSFPDNKLHLIFCDVGQGDAVLISKGFDQILIDGGPNDKVLECLSKNMHYFDRTIEIVALTHPEADHLTGIIPVMDKYQVNYFLTGPEGNNSAAFAALKLKVQSFGPAQDKSVKFKVINPYTGEKIKLGEISLQTLWPEKEWVISKLSNYQIANYGNSEEGTVLGASTTHAKLNDFSLVFLLEYKNFSALLMGDGDSNIQNDILRVNNLEPVDILKFPHHGSKTGMKEDFLKIIRPKEAVISVGKNSYGHPTTEALDLLQKYGIRVRRTDKEGDIKYQF